LDLKRGRELSDMGMYFGVDELNRQGQEKIVKYLKKENGN
jgi:hypothetical protein